ncbi:uncharacterized protein BJ171DRAFT_55792 [Polychytrium aggregatum]|uniref:uncharacterized protein n=1 Tax=Polychytrium aggregatum TaxID=110093 RepID=UPI0022FE32C0|nr:uncharacterized protein BJ171DRAFT_55792 [Polychytrium aggregatum]KAI9205974.1 hypothetical protein BJ171DRAFT_55792 [Polychytrium aggregatum]
MVMEQVLGQEYKRPPSVGRQHSTTQPCLRLKIYFKMRFLSIALAAVASVALVNANCVGGNACISDCYISCGWQGAASSPAVQMRCQNCIWTNCGTCTTNAPAPPPPSPSPPPPPPLRQCIGGNANACMDDCYISCGWQGASSSTAVQLRCQACISSSCNGC